jgi:uncharacterized protein
VTAVGLPAGGWPISQYILKVHSRCDLACDHCYVYEHADQSWRGRPMMMAPDVVDTVAARIAEHASAHHLSSVTVVLHGGEPLLLGPRRLGEVAAALRARIEPTARLDLRMQTNGVQLSEEFCELLAAHDIRVGISLDGDAAANDRHRRFANGASSHAKVRAALALLRRPEFHRQYAGILCTVDIGNDPIAVYEALRAEQPPRLDLLLPHATWEHPPPRPTPESTPYARWLLAFYDRWSADGRPMAIRVFDSIRSTGAGGPSGSEWLGLDRADLVVLETDGTWEQSDSLKTAYAGAPLTGLNVHDHAIDEVALLPEVIGRQIGLEGLAAQCRACPVVRQCGGGLYAHRYRPGTGFTNPSAYCADLLELIVSLNRRFAQVPAPGPDRAAPSHVPAEVIDRVGAGRADAPALRFLADAQQSITRALMVTVSAGGSAAAGAAWEVLTALDKQAPAALATTLCHPYVRVWAMDGRRHHDLDATAGDYLANVAAAAAVRAGVTVELNVPVRDGAIHLPSLGTIVLAQPSAGYARLCLRPGGAELRQGTTAATVSFSDDGDSGSARWLPNRRLAFGESTVLLEDLDPYRDCHDWKAAERLDPQQAAHWQETLSQAWRVLQSDAPEHVDALRGQLRGIVPLVSDPGGLLRSSTARQAFGSVAVAEAPADAVAVMIVHEFQHTVLGALLDLCDLYDARRRERLTVGWRTDPRPVEGVLQGTYAHLAITGIWHRRAARAGAPAADHQHYEQYRRWTADATAELLRSGALTPTGAAFVTRMDETLSGWPA